MIRVASLIPSLHFGGDEKRLLIFGAGVDKRRFEHQVLLMQPPSSKADAARGSLRTAYVEQGVAVETVDAEAPPGRGGIVRTGRLIRKLTDILRRRRIDILDARMNYAIGIGVMAARMAKVPVVVGTAYHHHTLSGFVKYPLGQASILALDALISDSQYVISGYQRWLLRPHPQAHVIPNGIPFPAAEKSRAQTLDFFQLPASPQTRIIGQVSRLMPFKGQEILIRAAAGALRQRPDLFLLLCGFATDPAYKTRLLNLAAELNIREKVRIAGYPGPVGDVWQIVDIHAHPTLLDSSPIAIHESMALGLPALVSDESGIPELVENGVTGLVVPKGDIDACREGLHRLLDNPELCARLGAGARARYLERHTPQAMVAATEQLFESLTGAKRPRPS